MISRMTSPIKTLPDLAAAPLGVTSDTRTPRCSGSERIFIPKPCGPRTSCTSRFFMVSEPSAPALRLLVDPVGDEVGDSRKLTEMVSSSLVRRWAMGELRTGAVRLGDDMAVGSETRNGPARLGDDTAVVNGCRSAAARGEL